jgi:hypothetical protein
VRCIAVRPVPRYGQGTTSPVVRRSAGGGSRTASWSDARRGTERSRLPGAAFGRRAGYEISARSVA